MELAKGSAEEAFDRSIDVHVSRLRQKLGDDPKRPAAHQDGARRRVPARRGRGVTAAVAGARHGHAALLADLPARRASCSSSSGSRSAAVGCALHRGAGCATSRRGSRAYAAARIAELAADPARLDGGAAPRPRDVRRRGDRLRRRRAAARDERRAAGRAPSVDGAPRAAGRCGCAAAGSARGAAPGGRRPPRRHPRRARARPDARASSSSGRCSSRSPLASFPLARVDRRAGRAAHRRGARARRGRPLRARQRARARRARRARARLRRDGRRGSSGSSAASGSCSRTSRTSCARRSRGSGSRSSSPPRGTPSGPAATSARSGRTSTELDGLVEDVLAAARLDARGAAGAARSRRAPVDLGAVARDAAERFRAAHAGRALEVDVAGALPAVRGDAALLRRLVANLLDNAAKYSEPAAPVRLVVRGRRGGRSCSRCGTAGSGSRRRTCRASSRRSSGPTGAGPAGPAGRGSGSRSRGGSPRRTAGPSPPRARRGRGRRSG